MSDEKKIIIDEDFKSQVAAEREALAEESSPTKEATGAPAGQELPPASLEMLITSLATEAMMLLGQLPQMGSEKVEADLPRARYTIDMLEVLQEKTKGNLTPEEEQAMGDLLHQLRMVFVAIQQVPPTTTDS